MSTIVICPCLVLRWVSYVETVDENHSAFLLKSIRISPVDQAVAFMVATKAFEDFVAIAVDVISQSCRIYAARYEGSKLDGLSGR